MHVLAHHEEGQWPYANILPTTKDAFEEAFDQTDIIKQQCIDHGHPSLPLDDIENFLLKAKKNSCIERGNEKDDYPWFITISIDKNGHLDMTGYSQIEKNYNFEFTIKYQNIKKD